VTALITIGKDDYILGVWTADGPTHNILITVIRNPDTRWHFHVRVREYVDDKIFEDSQDRKTFHEWTIGGEQPESKMITSATDIIHMASEFFDAPMINHALIRSSDMEVFHRAIQTMPGFHTQVRAVH